jgi:hypothetical protein
MMGCFWVRSQILSFHNPTRHRIDQAQTLYFGGIWRVTGKNRGYETAIERRLKGRQGLWYGPFIGRGKGDDLIIGS